jgi:hypothetical protein
MGEAVAFVRPKLLAVGDDALVAQDGAEPVREIVDRHRASSRPVRPFPAILELWLERIGPLAA